MPSVVETVNLVDAGEVADEIVKRLACNELSQETGHAIREMAKHGSLFYHHIVGFGSQAFMIETVFNPDGSVKLELYDDNRRPAWKTTLKAPPPAPRQVHVTHEFQCGYAVDHDDDD